MDARADLSIFSQQQSKGRTSAIQIPMLLKALFVRRNCTPLNMKKITIKSHEQYKLIKNIVSVVLLYILLLFTYTFFSIIYKGIEGKNYTTFSYALFAANAVLCNSLLAFGRSGIFIERFDKDEQKLIYFSSAMFLYAAIVGFFVSGWVYTNTDKNFMGDSFVYKTNFGHKFMLVSLSIGLGVSILFSIVGLVFFGRWVKKASDKVLTNIEGKRNQL
jgi:hypothetical protein